MKKILILSLFLLATLSWVVAAPAFAAEEGKKDEHAEKKEGGKEGGEGEKDKKASDVSGGRFAGDPVYVHLEPLVMPIITEDGAEQIVTLLIDIEVKDFDAGDLVHSNMPRVRDALLRALYGGLGSGKLQNGRMVNVTAIKNRATKAIGEVIGAENVREVLVQGVAQRVL